MPEICALHTSQNMSYAQRLAWTTARSFWQSYSESMGIRSTVCPTQNNT